MPLDAVATQLTAVVLQSSLASSEGRSIAVLEIPSDILQAPHRSGMYSERQPILTERSPDGRVHLEVLSPTAISPAFYANIVVHGVASVGFPFGYTALGDTISTSWDLPDNTLGVFIAGECYALFRFGARRRRRREYFRIGRENPFSSHDIAWITAKVHHQRRRDVSS